MNFVLNVVFQFVLLSTKKKFTFKSQILVSLIASVASMIAIPISVIYLNGLSSFIVTSAIILIQGLSNAILTSSFYSIISFLPFEYIIAFSTGQGIAGILMNVTRYLILAILGDPKLEDNIINGSLIFFSISAIILTLCVVFLFIIYKNPYFIHKMKNSGEFSEEQATGYSNLNESLDKENHIVNNVSKNSDKKINKADENFSFKSLMMMLLDFNFLIFVSFFVTFAVFPGVSLSQPLFNMDDSYKTNTIITLFNVFDTVGRNFPQLVPLSKPKLSFLTFFRFIFMLTFPLVGVLASNTFTSTSFLSILTIINMVAFAFLNGYVASTTFSLAPEQVPDEIKGKSGSSISLFLIIGIFSGSLFATCVMQNFV